MLDPSRVPCDRRGSIRVTLHADTPQSLRIGSYPTPVFHARELSGPGGSLWVKNDGVSAELYGGNKIRKLELVLAEAQRRGARRIVTTGAGGSHHVLATALYAGRVGLPVCAVLCPQPWTEHAEQTLRASLAAGVEPVVVGSMARVPFGVARVLRRGDFFVPAGGSSTLGTLGYLRAVSELAGQIRAGELPEPDLLIAPLGSGGTVAGLLAGVLREGLKTRVVGVDVAVSERLSLAMVMTLALAATRRDHGSAGLVRLRRQLELDARELGGGYGHPTERGARASEAARRVGLELDPTYTAKTFARALAEVRAPGNPERVVLYLHTLSARPWGPLLARAPAALPEELCRLLPRMG